VVVDIDAHHGNGTQAIFYDRADVLTACFRAGPRSAGRSSSAARTCLG